MFTRQGRPAWTTVWSRPEMQSTQPVNGAISNERSNSNFLTVEHRDSWSPSWNGASNTYATAPTGNYDFFLA